jgi:beta-glucosidase
VPRPPRELKGFAKVNLAPGGKTTVRLALSPMDLSFFDPVENLWRAEDGTFEIQVGPHSQDGLVCRLEYRA